MAGFFRFMAGFFQRLGRRKRLGVRALVLALMVTVGWIRSLAVYDEVTFHTGSDRSDSLLSTDSSIGWERRTGFEFRNARSISFMEFFLGNPFVDISSSKDPGRSRWDWKWYCYGFASGVAQYGNFHDETHLEHRNVWIVPYWSIVVPLTLVSLWLLLKQPRRLMPKKISEPIPAGMT